MKTFLAALLLTFTTLPAYAQVSITRSLPPTTRITVTTAAGTTVTDDGGVYKVTLASSGIVCAATTCDVTLGTLPAKTKVLGVLADLTQTFACTATCTSSTLSFTVGKTAGGNEYILSTDADAATGTFGLTAAQTGASLVASAAQGGDIPSFSTTTTYQVRFTSGTGNFGNATVTNLSQGSITFYLLYRVLP
jgi:hypothetical protein